MPTAVNWRVGVSATARFENVQNMYVEVQISPIFT